jgi:hypothetical protein
MIDYYTKAVLTVIAVCLGLLVVRGITGESAVAQSGQVHVIIDSANSSAFQYAGPLRVTCDNCR